MHFAVVDGAIEDQTAHALVAPTARDVHLDCGVGGAIQRRIDDDLPSAVQSESPLECGDVVVTQHSRLPARSVFTVVDMDERGNATAESIRTATEAILSEADARGYRSIVVPLLGCGGGDYPCEDGARALCETIWDHEPVTLADVRVVAHSSADVETLRAVAIGVTSTDRDAS